MQRIMHITAENNRFTTGTVITNDWLNGVQEEIINVIESEKIKPTTFNNQQLNLAIDNKIHNATNVEPIKDIVNSFSNDVKEMATKINTYVDKNNDVLISYINSDLKQKLDSLKNENANIVDSLNNKLAEIKNSLNNVAADIKKIEDINKDDPKDVELKTAILNFKNILNIK